MISIRCRGVFAQHVGKHIRQVIFLTRTPVDLFYGLFQREDLAKENMAKMSEMSLVIVVRFDIRDCR